MTTARAPFDPSLYLVTDTAMCSGRGVAATAAAAVRAGAGMVQLRDPAATDAEFVELGRSLAAQLRGTGVPLIVNDRVHLVAAIGAAGAHVGQGDTDPHEARRLLGPQALLGLSVQNVGQVHDVLARQVDVDYLGVGPVWAQVTKADAAAPCGVAGLHAIAAASPWPCVAIGGIDVARVAAVRAAGARGIAVVSAICAAADPASATAQLAAAWAAAA